MPVQVCYDCVFLCVGFFWGGVFMMVLTVLNSTHA